jgi:inosose dehydratase
MMRLLAATAAGPWLVPRGAGAQASRYQFGYAAITWGGRDRDAIRDIAAVGFRGIQLRAAAFETFGASPVELKDLLAAHRLTMVALSSGNVSVDGDVASQIATHVGHAQFVRDVGGKYLQILDTRPSRAIVADDFTRLGQLLTELGKRTADLGIPLGYHNHMGAIGEAPDEVARVMAAVDPRYVKLELDVAHYQQGGGDPAKAVRDFGSSLLFLHLKDVEARTPAAKQPRPFRFVELGRGRVDLPAVMRALDEVRFSGWLVVELDAVPDNSRTPRESAEINKRYLIDVLGQTL